MDLEKKMKLRSSVRSAYDLQKTRMSLGLRIVNNMKVKLGQKPGTREEDIPDKEKQKIIKTVRASYERITDGVVVNLGSYRKLIKKDAYDEVISDYGELTMADLYVTLLSREEEQFKMLIPLIREFPIWTEYLVDVKGIGPALAGVLISEIDITKARYVSSIWKYAGLDVAQDGRGRSRQKAHLIDIDYIDSDQNPVTKKGITYNPFLKTKMIGVLPGSFLKAKSPYANVYYNYKTRILSRELSKLHTHNMAMRYMVKRFLADLYVAWRTLEGLPVEPDYHEGKLGHKHGGPDDTPN